MGNHRSSWRNHIFFCDISSVNSRIASGIRDRTSCGNISISQTIKRARSDNHRIISNRSSNRSDIADCACTITSTIGNVGPVTGAITDNAVIIASGALNGLADGNITATCSVSDTTGNPAVNGTDIAEKDVVAPTAPVIAHIAVDEKINIAEKAAIVVVGTAESGSIINVSLSDAIHTVSNSGVATGGAYSITIDGTTLTDGTITPSVIATDAAGNESGADTDPTAAQDTALPTIISITSNATGVGWLKVGNSIIFTLTPGSAEVGASVVGSYNGVVLFWNTAN